LETNRYNILITGATSGIGKSLAEAFALPGNTLFLTGRNAQKLKELNLHRTPEKCTIIPMVSDFEKPHEVANACNTLLKHTHRLEVLIHNAAVAPLGNIESISESTLNSTLDINLKAPVLVTKMLLPALLKAKGWIVFINSRIVHSHTPGLSLYGITKDGLKAFSETLRNEYGEQGLRITNLYLGKTATPMLKNLLKNQGMDYDPTTYIQPGDVARMIRHISELPPTAELTDLYIKHTSDPS
jgi:NADP-dependent 3-hydroxy acid dehydrogenase YdfG